MMPIINRIICIDFDGTCVTHEYPNIGRDIGAIPVLRQLVNLGNKLILHTMRDNEALQEAVNWFAINRIELYGINSNPSQPDYLSDKKVYAHLYIDDAALGCPLVKNQRDRPYVDWDAVRKMLLS